MIVRKIELQKRTTAPESTRSKNSLKSLKNSQKVHGNQLYQHVFKLQLGISINLSTFPTSKTTNDSSGLLKKLNAYWPNGKLFKHVLQKRDRTIIIRNIFIVKRAPN